MNTAVRLFIAAIALLAMVNHADADGDRDDAEVVLEAGEINSSTVEVDDFVIVVYGQGKQQPTSGEWAKLDTMQGYVKAVKRRVLVLSLERYGWPESIALERIQTLTLVDPPASVRTDDMGVGKRIANKLAAGALLGSGGAFLLGSLGATGCSSGDTFCGVGVLLGMVVGYPVATVVGVSMIDPHDRFLLSLGESVGGLVMGSIIVPNNLALIDSLWELWPLFVGSTVGATWASEWFRNPPNARSFSERMNDKAGWRIANKMGAGILSGFAFGFLGSFSESENGASMSYVIGVPIGMSMVDSRDRFAYSLAGSLLGTGAAVAMKSGILLLVLPPVTATLGSELFRSPPKTSQTRRFSVGLVPNPKKGLSAIATLRF